MLHSRQSDNDVEKECRYRGVVSERRRPQRQRKGRKSVDHPVECHAHLTFSVYKRIRNNLSNSDQHEENAPHHQRIENEAEAREAPIWICHHANTTVATTFICALYHSRTWTDLLIHLSIPASPQSIF